MKITYKIINDGQIFDSYIYSKEDFLHNGESFFVKDKMSKLLYLYTLTSDWQENEFENIKNGFYIRINSNKFDKEYFFSNKLPNNFLSFDFEVKRISMGE